VPKDESGVIRISGDVAKRLEARGKFGQTYLDVIASILDEVEKLENQKRTKKEDKKYNS